MKKNIILTIVVIFVGAIIMSCEKEKTNNLQYQTLKDLNIDNITISNGMLSFSSWEQYFATVEALGNACENWTRNYVDSLIKVLGTDDDDILNDAIQKEGFNQFQPLCDFAKAMDFNSMYEVLENSEKEWMNTPNSAVEDNPFIKTELERYQSALHNVDGDVMIDGQIFNPDKCISDDGDCLRRNKYDDSKSFTYKNKGRLLVGKISTRSAYLSASTTLYTVKNNGTKILWTSGIYVASGGNKWITCAAGDVPENILPLPDKSKRRDALCYTSVTTLTHSLTCVIIPYPASLLSSHAATKVSGASVNLAM